MPGELVAVLDGLSSTGSDLAFRYAVIVEVKPDPDGSKVYYYSMQYSKNLKQWISLRAVTAERIGKIPLSEAITQYLPRII